MDIIWTKWREQWGDYYFKSIPKFDDMELVMHIVEDDPTFECELFKVNNVL